MISQDLVIIIVLVGAAFAIISMIVTMIFWIRSELNSLRADTKDDPEDLIYLTREIEALQAEIRDFHYRLLEIFWLWASIYMILVLAWGIYWGLLHGKN